MIKFRIYYDKDKDEAFINRIAKKGYALKKFFLGFYTFEETKEKYTYRIDLDCQQFIRQIKCEQIYIA